MFLESTSVEGVRERVVRRKWSNKQEDCGRSKVGRDQEGISFEYGKFKMHSGYTSGIQGRRTGWKYNHGNHQYIDNISSQGYE